MAFKSILGAICLCFLLLSTALSEVPQMINYQGKLTTPQGALIDTTVRMTFAIYPVSTDGIPLWSETHNSVVVEKGIFSILLGSITSIPSQVFEEKERYLGIKVGDDPEMTPRKRIASVAYAYKAEYADTADYALVAVPDDDWDIDTAGINVYRLTGNVGIGTPNPQGKLDINGSLAIGGNVGDSGQVLRSQGAGANPVWADVRTLNNVVFMFGNGWDCQSGAAYETEYGLYNKAKTLGHDCLFWAAKHTGSEYVTILRAKFVKIAWISTITVYAYWYAKCDGTPNFSLWNRLKVDVGGQSNYVEHQTYTDYWGPDWEIFDVDVSGLTNGTVYDVQIQLQAERDGYQRTAFPELYFIMGVAH
jgi:hypothetical protein